MADGGMMDMGGLGSLAGGGGGKGGGDAGAGGVADMSGLGADGAGMGMDGGMGGMGGDLAGGMGSGMMADQSMPSLQAAAQGDPTGAVGATQAVSGGTPSAPGTAGGVGGVQSAPQPSGGVNLGQTAAITPTSAVPPASMPTAQLGSTPVAPANALPNTMSGQPSVAGPTGFTGADAESGSEPNTGNTPSGPDYSQQSSNTAGKGDRLDINQPNRSSPFYGSRLDSLASQALGSQGATGNTVMGGDPTMPSSGNVNTLGDLDPFSSSIAGGDVVPGGAAVSPTNEGLVSDAQIPGSQPTQPTTGDLPQAGGDQQTPQTPSAGPGGQATPPTAGAAPTTPPSGGTPTPKAPAAAPSAPSTAGGQPGGQPGGGGGGGQGGGINPMAIIQAFLRGGPIGGLMALAQQAMGQGAGGMFGPSGPWAPGYGPNNQTVNPQTERQFAPHGRDQHGNPRDASGQSQPPMAGTPSAPRASADPPGTPPSKSSASPPPTAGAVPPDSSPQHDTAGPAGTAPGMGAAAKPMDASQVAYTSQRFPLQGGVHQTQPTVDRGSFNDELARNPLVDGVPLDKRMFQMVAGEVGRNAPANVKIAQLETAFNRAYARNHSLSQALWTHNMHGHGGAGYYPYSTMNPRNLPSDAELQKFNREVLAPVRNGSNYNDIGYGPMTGNASSDLAARQLGRMPGYKMRGGDTYFREGPFKRSFPQNGTPQSSATPNTQTAALNPRDPNADQDPNSMMRAWQSIKRRDPSSNPLEEPRAPVAPPGTPIRDPGGQGRDVRISQWLEQNGGLYG